MRKLGGGLTTPLPAAMSTGVLFCLFAFAASAGGQTTVHPPPLPAALEQELEAWLESHGQSPERYVVDLFAEHDVVFLGEQHRIRHDVLFVASLVEPVYAASVHTLGLEFGRREDQPLIDRLLAGSEWDEELAREIKRQVWRGGGEEHWARVILDAVQSGQKVLVYSGIHHAFTEYRQPIVSDGEFTHFDRSLRAGNHVFNSIGKRMVTVFLHAPWSGSEGYGSTMRHPADGVIDALMLSRGPYPVGFDLNPGPFGQLRVEDAGEDPPRLGCSNCWTEISRA